MSFGGAGSSPPPSSTFSKVSALVDLLYKDTTERTFQNVHLLGELHSGHGRYEVFRYACAAAWCARLGVVAWFREGLVREGLVREGLVREGLG